MLLEYTYEPEYQEHGYKEDVLNVLVCQIKVWKATSPNWFDVPDKCTIITEVEEIEIQETYKELINGAVIRLPKGSIINETIQNKGVDDSVDTGNKTGQTAESKMSESTRYGELLTIENMTSKNGEHTLMIDDEKNDTGLAPESENKFRTASPHDFQVGNRIEIWLGYIYQRSDMEDIVTEKLQKVKNGERIEELCLMFTGFITGCSVSSPLEIECENMASLLKKKTSRKGIYKGQYSVNDFLADGGKFDLLKGTGLHLSDTSRSANIKLSNFEISDGLSVYEMIHSWSRAGLYSCVSRDGYEIKVGQFTMSEDEWQNDKERIDYTSDKHIQYIQSDWDVVNDGLSVKRVDKDFLVVRAKAHVKDEKSNDNNTKKGASVLVGKINGEWHVDKHDSRVHKQQKRKKGQSGKPETISKFDLNKYYIVDHEPNKGIDTIDDLIKEAKLFWDNWNSNGISGSLTIFGDLNIQPTQIVGYISTYSPEKNGHYFVESVKTTFGVNGYRQTLTIPRKISDFKRVIKTI